MAVEDRTTKKCQRCKNGRLHRERRIWVDRWFAYLLPRRPYFCGTCGHRGRYFAAPPEFAKQYLCSLIVWVAAMVAAIATLSSAVATSPSTGASDLRVAVVAQPTLKTPAPAEPPATSPAPVNAVPEARTQAPVVATSAPAALPAHQLKQVDLQWNGTSVLIVLNADPGPFTYSVSTIANMPGYIVDIAGRWTVAAEAKLDRKPRRVNLSDLRIGQHAGFLRIVLQVRSLKPGPPAIQVTPAGLVIRVDER